MTILSFIKRLKFVAKNVKSTKLQLKTKNHESIYFGEFKNSEYVDIEDNDGTCIMTCTTDKTKLSTIYNTAKQFETRRKELGIDDESELVVNIVDDKNLEGEYSVERMKYYPGTGTNTVILELESI
jgi:hypothetical protein